MEFSDIAVTLWQGLGFPLLRIVFYISLGLMVANFIEALNWTHNMARIASPLIRIGHLSDVTGASFSMAFFSGVSANTMLAEGYDQGKINERELVLANLFNSLPTYFLHLPTVFFITAPLIKGAAFIYVGLTFFAAVLRTFLVLFLGRMLLPVQATGNIEKQLAGNRVNGWRQALDKAWKRFKKRIKKVLYFTVPIYTIIFAFHKAGIFHLLEQFISDHLSFLSWLNPQSIGIIVLHVAAEFTAGLAMAGALINAGDLGYREVVLALLVGNVLSSPMRAVRHQFPYYAGIFPTGIAVKLIIYNQAFRVGSIILLGIGYYLLTI
ncbi:MAG: hypothetical protein KQH63_00365 [Desulfobulbaceae bacterium]|nr:hypothetical protein [Desulfobulbaceae bacterium]